MTSVLTLLCPKDEKSQDPGKGNNNIASLLDESGATMKLMTGVLFTAPPPVVSKDTLPEFEISDSVTMDIPLSGDVRLPQSFPGWAPAEGSGDGPGVRDAVHDKWKTPVVEEAGRQNFVSDWAKAFSWDSGLVKFAEMPKNLEKRFDQTYMAVPRLTVG